MEPSVYLLCYLHNLLLLQGLTHLYQLRRVPLENGLVHITGIRESHDDVPTHLLGIDLKRLRHVGPLGQQRRVVPVGHTQQHSFAAGLQTPHSEITGRRHQRTVVIVHRLAQRIIIGIDLAARLQQFHLVGKPSFRENAYSLLSGCLVAPERHIEVDDFLHSIPDTLHVVWGHLCPVLDFLLEVTIVSARQRVLNKELRTGKKVLCSLVEHKAQ